MIRLLHRRFGTILWKLTGTYVLVSFMFVLTLIIATFGGVIWYINSQMLPIALADDARLFAEVMSEDFARPDVNNEQLAQSLHLLNTFLDTFSTSQQSNEATTITINTSNQNSTVSPSNLFIALLDSSGQIITTTQPLDYEANVVFSEVDQTNSYPIIRNALGGVTDAEQLVTWSEPNRQPAATSPIFDSNGEVVGVVYIRMGDLPSTTEILSSSPSVALVVMIPWLVFSLLIGLLYAWLGGRGFSRRLQRLTRVSAAIANGQLDQRVEDHSVDEIGQLGRQFNTMADQLSQNVLQLRVLADRNAQLAEQAAQLATVEERNRLARELHDSVSQDLFSLNMLTAATKRLIATRPELAAEQLEEVQQTSQHALHELRGLIFALRPATLDDRGLVHALRDLAQSVQERQNLKVDLHISGERWLPLESEQALFRIVQEALANVVRHSGVHHAQVKLHYNDQHVSLTVQDKGRGFETNVSRKPTSFGLTSMAERAEALGGQFEAQSAPNKGTTICVTLPSNASLTYKD
ncbi:MAG: sensor histidine kinase [Chloroflexota bacterium]